MGISTLGAICENENEILLPSMEINKLFMLDLRKGSQVKGVGILKNYEKEQAWKILKAISWNGKTFFFARNSYELWEVDCEKTVISHRTYYTGTVAMITNVEKYKEKVWIFQNSFKAPVLCLNLNNMKCEAIMWPMDVCLGECSITKAVQKEGKIYFATRKEEQIYLIIVDCERGNIEYEYLGGLAFINCLEIGEDQSVWVFGYSKADKTVLQKYILKKGKIEEYRLHLTQQLSRSILLKYHRMFLFNNKFFLIPALAEKIVTYDLFNGKEEILDYPKEFCFKRTKNDPSIFFDMQQIKEKLYLFPHASEQMLIIDLGSSEIRVIEVTCGKEEYDKALLKAFDLGEKIMESTNVSLTNFIFCVYKKRGRLEEKKENKGEEIYRGML